MEFDVIEKVATVERAVRQTTRDGRPANVIVAARTYPTDAEDLWDALTDQERLPRWFAPVEGDLRVGGRFQVTGNAGGEVLACERPTRFEITWEMPDAMSWVEITLTPDGADTTRLELRHTALVPEDTTFWDTYGPGAVGVGWDLSLLGLDLHVATGEAKEPGIETDPRVLDFSARSSEAWGDASVAGGTDPVAARAAAERTTAFYTTIPE